MNTTWLLSMETLMSDFGKEFAIKVNYARYRLIQIFAIYAGLLINKDLEKIYQELKKKMHFDEWLRYGLILSTINRIAPDQSRGDISLRIQRVSGSHPASHMPEIEGTFQTILDVFEHIDERFYLK